jgi:hypothetical protein
MRMGDGHNWHNILSSSSFYYSCVNLSDFAANANKIFINRRDKIVLYGVGTFYICIPYNSVHYMDNVVDLLQANLGFAQSHLAVREKRQVFLSS